jgi:CheY-like chemotaxis protein
MSLANSVGVRRAAGPTVPPAAGAPGALKRLRPEVLAAPVLIVEDEAMIAWMLETLLEEMGFAAITIVATGSDALAAAAQLSPGLIVSDINLGPGRLDGIDAAATIRRTLPAQVLFLTGHASVDALDRIRRNVPGSIVLRKPVNAETLRRALLGLLGQTQSN